MAQEYAQLHFRLETGSASGGQLTVRYAPGRSRVPSPSLAELLDLAPHEQLLFILDFETETAPQIWLYDLPRHLGTMEQVYSVLADFLGEFRCRRGSRPRELFIDFVDANRALLAFRKMQASELFSAFKQAKLLNVPFFSADDDTVPS